MTLPASLETRWTHPQAFESYEVARSAVAPALSLAIQRSLEYIPEGGQVLEIGAGAGAFRRYGGETAQTFAWTESDHNPDFLTLPREGPVKKIVARLPELPIEPESVDAVVGLGVLDTLANETVDQTMASAYTALREGGVLVHLMDMAPDMIAEIHNSRKQGVFPLPYLEDERLGICYIDLKNIGQQLKTAELEEPTANVLLSIIRDPNKYIPLTTQTAILPYLGNLAIEKGWAVDQIPDWMKHFGNRLGIFASKHGFKILANHMVEEEALQKRARVPLPFREANVVLRKHGALRAGSDPSVHIPDYVKAIANVHVFAAHK